jgi:hypothetical protein
VAIWAKASVPKLEPLLKTLAWPVDLLWMVPYVNCVSGAHTAVMQDGALHSRLYDRGLVTGLKQFVLTATNIC